MLSVMPRNSLTAKRAHQRFTTKHFFSMQFATVETLSVPSSKSLRIALNVVRVSPRAPTSSRLPDPHMAVCTVVQPHKITRNSILTVSWLLVLQVIEHRATSASLTTDDKQQQETPKTSLHGPHHSVARVLPRDPLPRQRIQRLHAPSSEPTIPIRSKECCSCWNTPFKYPHACSATLSTLFCRRPLLARCSLGKVRRYWLRRRCTRERCCRRQRRYRRRLPACATWDPRECRIGNGMGPRQMELETVFREGARQEQGTGGRSAKEGIH